MHRATAARLYAFPESGKILPFRHIFHISRHTARLTIYALLLGAAVFFAITRTQVGRDALRSELERQFENRFHGRLEIGRLTGNLISDLFARDVRVFDPAGRVVAAIDSVVVRPRWRDLFGGAVTINKLTLIHPRFYLFRQENGDWNIADAFRPRSVDSTRAPGSWAYTSADLHIIDGTVSTERAGSLPPLAASGRLFDYTKTKLENIQARATVEWRPGLKLVELAQFTARWPEQAFDLDMVQGQFVREPDGLSLNRVEVHAGQTHLSFSASLRNVHSFDPDTLQQAVAELQLRPSSVDFDQLRSIFPALPLAGAVTAEIALHGPVQNLTLDHLALESGQTWVEGEGTIKGLPSVLDFETDLTRLALFSEDITRVLPGIHLPDFSHLGVLDMEFSGAGSMPLRKENGADPLYAETELSMRSAGGAVHGKITISGGETAPLHYVADLRVDSLDVGHIVRNDNLRSRINGRLALDGQGVSMKTLAAGTHIHLNPSQFAGRYVDTLSAEINVVQQQFQGIISGRQGQGTFAGVASLDLGAALPAYQLDLTTRQLDAGNLLLRDSLDTQINARLVVDGVGLALPELRGEAALALDSSTVREGQRLRVIPPNAMRLVLHPRGDVQPRLTVQGEAGSLELRGDFAIEPLSTLTRLWSESLSLAVQREAAKPRSDSMSLPDLLHAALASPAPSPKHIQLRESARRQMQAAGVDSLMKAEVALQIYRPDILAAFFPSAPSSAAFGVHAHVKAGADHLQFDGTLLSDSLRAGTVHVRGLEAALTASAHLDSSAQSSLTFALEARADSVQRAGRTVIAPDLAVTYEDRKGEIFLTVNEDHAPEALRVAAAVDLLPSSNRLTLVDFRLKTGDYVWTNPAPYPIDLFSDAVLIPDLALVSSGQDSSDIQRIHIHGAFSQAPEDTLFADVDNISLLQLSTSAGLNPRLGGLLHAELSLTGGARHPELTGYVDVPVLAYDNRLLGRFSASSRYVPGSPDVALEVSLDSLPAGSELRFVPDSAIPALAEENKLAIDGVFRLPRLNTNTQTMEPGELDLNLRAVRADAFFFEYLFPTIVDRVSGYLSGTGSIRGTFGEPLFEADLQLTDGRFDVPTYNLTYHASGPVKVDTEGIKVLGATLTDKTGGRATINGSILFNAYRYFSFDLTGQLDELQIIDVMQSRDLAFYGNIWASGTATLTGPIYRALLQSPNVVTSAQSEIFIPITEGNAAIDPGFIIFADSTGEIPDLTRIVRRDNVLATRPVGERTFIDGLEMDLNITAPSGSTVHLVIDPLLGDVINAVGQGRIQLQRREGEFYTFGSLDVDAGDYLFTAGDVFIRRFLIDDGSITWDGDPTDAQLDILASYRTRASLAGLHDLPGISGGGSTRYVPLTVEMHITGRVSTPVVDLSLAVDRNDRDVAGEGLEAILNQPERATEYATSVLLTSSFLLTTELPAAGFGEGSSTRNQFAFNSLSQLVASQINRYLSQALPNLDFNFGVQGERTQDLDITYGVALRLLDERLVIRGQGVYQNDLEAYRNRGEFIVEVRLSPNVSVEVFYRREGDVLSDQTLTNTTGAGLSYQTRFSNWRRLFERLLGLPPSGRPVAAAKGEEPVAEKSPEE